MRTGRQAGAVTVYRFFTGDIRVPCATSKTVLARAMRTAKRELGGRLVARLHGVTSQLGAAVDLAVLVRGAAAGGGNLHERATGYHWAFAGAAGIAVATALVTSLLLRPSTEDARAERTNSGMSVGHPAR